jgi:hypothetical protein
MVDGDVGAEEKGAPWSLALVNWRTEGSWGWRKCFAGPPDQDTFLGQLGGAGNL